MGARMATHYAEGPIALVRPEEKKPSAVSTFSSSLHSFSLLFFLLTLSLALPLYILTFMPSCFRESMHSTCVMIERSR